jgi:hypothetical protein
MGALKAFGGAPLVGDRLVRFAHLDEAGTSAREPYAIVAGVVSQPDLQWRALQQYLSDMADDLVPSDLRKGIVFHAKDLWHGSGQFPRDRFSRDLRVRILTELANIPVNFDIPVIVNGTKKADLPETQNKNAVAYSIAFGMAVIGVEHVMRAFCEADEVAMVIAEDLPSMRQHAKWGFQRLMEPEHWDQTQNKLLPVTRVAETPQFAEKTDSSILQVADLVAFVTCRRLNDKEDVQFLLDKFKDNIVTWPGWASYLPRPRPTAPLGY